MKYCNACRVLHVYLCIDLLACTVLFSLHLFLFSVPIQLRQLGVNTIFVEVVNEDPSFLVDQYRAAAQTMPDYSQRASDWEAVSCAILLLSNCSYCRIIALAYHL